ncbi:hypothetical protein G9A89_011089 [Geosiphon pyriformis]|nr:hypothetical protein G9A89_011089 [Geosiphon pyriformis]
MGGALQSRPTGGEPIVIYNEPEVRLRFSQELVTQLQKPALSLKKIASPNLATSDLSLENIESIIQTRVTAELERREHLDSEVQKAAQAELSKEEYWNDGGSNALVTEQDIEELIKLIQRKSEVKIPKLVEERQKALISCYMKNKTRILDCSEEVENFKESAKQALRVGINL